MSMSIFLAKFFGLYLGIMVLALYMRREQLMSAARQMVNQPALMLFGGAMTLLLGITLIVSHNLWVLDWPLIVTLLCWAVFIKGVVLVLMPDKMTSTLAWLESGKVFWSILLVDAALALVMLYYGFCPAATGVS